MLAEVIYFIDKPMYIKRGYNRYCFSPEFPCSVTVFTGFWGFLYLSWLKTKTRNFHKKIKGIGCHFLFIFWLKIKFFQFSVILSHGFSFSYNYRHKHHIFVFRT